MLRMWQMAVIGEEIISSKTEAWPLSKMCKYYFVIFPLNINGKNIWCPSVTDTKCPFLQKIIIIKFHVLRIENNHTPKTIIENQKQGDTEIRLLSIYIVLHSTAIMVT